MLLGFQRRFEQYVFEGSKTHTIRAKRKLGPPKVGETLHCYGNVRQKDMHLIGRFECAKVEDIRLFVPKHADDYDNPDSPFGIVLDAVLLTYDEAISFAWRDGFRDTRPGPEEQAYSLRMMGRFWRATYGMKPGGVAWSGDLIHWRYSDKHLGDPTKIYGHGFNSGEAFETFANRGPFDPDLAVTPENVGKD